MTVLLTAEAERLLKQQLEREPQSSAAAIIEQALAVRAGKTVTDRGDRLPPVEAVDELRRLRQGIRLGGLSVKSLITEGRKY